MKNVTMVLYYDKVNHVVFHKTDFLGLYSRTINHVVHHLNATMIGCFKRVNHVVRHFYTTKIPTPRRYGAGIISSKVIFNTISQSLFVHGT